jgi:thiosulfate/3-mercaptopyruvate sulfurtransferase
MAGRVPLLVSCKELRSLLSTPNNNVRLLDATWFMPNSPRNPLAEHAKSRLPAAAFWDVDRIASDHPLGLKHMLPHAAQFSRACS